MAGKAMPLAVARARIMAALCVGSTPTERAINLTRTVIRSFRLLVRLNDVASGIVNANHDGMRLAVRLCVADCVHDCIWPAIPQRTVSKRIAA